MEEGERIILKAEDLAETVLLWRKVDGKPTIKEMHEFIFTEAHANLEIVNLTIDLLKEADEWFDKPTQ